MTVRVLRWVIGFCHICSFMAGANSTGVDGGRAHAVRHTTSSVRPPANLAIRSAVAGAMIISWHHWAKAMWGDSRSCDDAKISVSTGEPERLSNVAGPTNRQAAGVIRTRTDALA